MRLFINFLVLFFCISATSVFGEGSRQLQITDGVVASLHLKRETYTAFGLFGAPSPEQLKVFVSDTTEKIYFGFNPVTGNATPGNFNPNTQYRILAPDGSVVIQGTLINNGVGHIQSWAETDIGPQQVTMNPNGYNAIEVSVKDTGDFVIEFNPPNLGITINTVDIKYFDVTVVDTLGTVKNGRLHSQGWQLSTGNTVNKVDMTLYPYGLNGVVYAVEFDDFQPFGFLINFNSFGVRKTGNIISDRQSTTGLSIVPEYEVFLNPPDEEVFPTNASDNFTFEGTATIENCLSRQFCLQFSSESRGVLEGFIDVNGDGEYVPEDGDRLFGEEFSKDTTKCIEWDGKDAFGNDVDLNIAKVYSAFGYGVMHLPLYDIESNSVGFSVKTVRPSNGKNPLIYWDDTGLPPDRVKAGDELLNLTGCATNCHTWVDRGENNANSEFINTWWYADLDYDTIDFKSDIFLPVKNSFRNNSLDKGPRVFCPGDSVEVFVYQDGQDHYDDAKYKYIWYVDSVLTDSNKVSQKYQFFDTTNVIIESILRFDSTCVSRDTLVVVPTDSVRIAAKLTNAFCNEGGALKIDLISSPPNVVFSWSNGSSDTSLTLLSPGIYSLNVNDIDFPNCSLDTSFTIVDTVDFALDSIVIDSANCSRADGSIEVYMKNKNYTYEYSWDNSPFLADDSIRSPLNFGNYDLSIKIQNTTFAGCTLDSNLVVPGYDTSSVKLSFQRSILDKETRTLCPEDTLSTYIVNYGDHFDAIKYDYSWFLNDVLQTPKNQKLFNSFKDSTQIMVTATVINDPSCTVSDSLMVLITDTVTIDSLVKDAFCINNGSIEINLLSAPPNPVITWSNGVTNKNKIDSLAPGNYSLEIMDPDYPKCGFMVSFDIIETINFGLQDLSVVVSDCFYPKGFAEATMIEPNYTYRYTWDSTPTFSNTLDLVSVGLHTLNIKVDSFPSCQLNTSFRIEGSSLFYNLIKRDEICSNNNGLIGLDVSSPGVQVVWDDGAPSDLIRQNVSAGTYSFTLFNSNDIDCRVTGVITVKDSTSTISTDIIYEDREAYRALEDIEFEAIVSNEVTFYEWQVNEAKNGNNNTMSYLFDDQGDYVVSVSVIDSNGCRGYHEVFLTIIDPKPCGLAVPTAFSPNGDNYNDVLNILGEAFDVDLQIYNRWGESIFRAYDYDAYWDGGNRSDDTPVGVFPYILTYKCPAKGRTMKSFKKVGDITLVR